MTTSELYAADVEALVGVLDDARSDDPGPAMPWALLEDLQRLVPSDLGVSFQHHEPSASRSLLVQGVEIGGQRADIAGPTPEEPDDPFWRYWWQGLCSWPQRTGDLRRVIQTRDFLPTERDRLADPVSELLPELRETMIISLPAAPGEARRVCFMRHDGPSFTERDRQLATLLRPHLQEIWLDAERRRAGVPKLTAREWEVLALAAAGMPYAVIAAQLFISVGTVRKHMEHVRERLGVHSIPAAAARAMPHAPGRLRTRSTAGCPPASPGRGGSGGR
ncbi:MULTISPECIES: helix-turn-helix transcriptional regulator [unclassified Modestobacter]|uniref:helix-turn-helix transcriptional regulator n=1 Tax=unclassified Modestobacter TaxID=2643866 RepID=UPI0022AABC07|nr:MULTISPECIES: LuxR family transcriptional regulator [unclassified Modestobacter]MCZ2813144.1 LuxR C-terminal-related transcriptional regulator [Modestobacter sp. VKM Ac-2979]MCZ2842827.1 LuxR C-terminal-related transcriptional regulator [Modestobacter sp. VKM Ac-2980]MCZ2847433.1 LuxR C-terminal-related transcriptional regulator [Modestobacter sp. VKM Ac-2978]